MEAKALKPMLLDSKKRNKTFKLYFIEKQQVHQICCDRIINFVFSDKFDLLTERFPF